MSNFLNTILDIGKKAAQQVVNTATAGGASNPIAGTSWQGTGPIVEQEAGSPFVDALKKVRDDLVNTVRGAARDTAKAAAGGAADALAGTDVFQKKQRLATAAVLGVGVLAIFALVLAVRKPAMAEG